MLLLAKAALRDGVTDAQLQEVMSEFYRLIPHKAAAATEVVTLALLARKEDLCQVGLGNTRDSARSVLGGGAAPSLTREAGAGSLKESVAFASVTCLLPALASGSSGSRSVTFLGFSGLCCG